MIDHDSWRRDVGIENGDIPRFDDRLAHDATLHFPFTFDHPPYGGIGPFVTKVTNGPFLQTTVEADLWRGVTQ